MAYEEELEMHVRVVKPSVSFLPETETSKPVTYDLHHSDLLPVYDYVSQEYLMKGVAVANSYCTRLLLRCPADPDKFSGLVVAEPSHLWGGTTIWRLISRWLMRNGHAWLEIDSQAPAAIDQIKNVDPERYKDMHFIPCRTLEEFSSNIPSFANAEELWENYRIFKERWWSATLQSPEILVAASHALRSGQLGIKADRVVLAGLSQTADLIRKFIVESRHFRLPDGYAPFQGFMPCQCDGGDPLPDLRDAKIIEILGEFELVYIKALYGGSEAPPHRRPDSPSFRLYEVAGMSHRETRYLSMADNKRLSVVDLEGAQWTTFASSFVYHALFDAMNNWITTGVAPPRGTTIEVDNFGDIERDEYGNALAGVRTVHTDVPTAKIIDVTPQPHPHWHTGTEVPFKDVNLWALYKTVENYRRQAGEAIDRQIEAGFLLPEDAEVLRRDTIEQVSF
ncbi:hypothetical protein N7489_000600 [Penicillium chrysogenum]|uniref:Alpha/beta hydrolase domain-containing protein n=1 Tax=Penicillium chrysogenum TaxID=5076 RepID=A0ABQ8WJ61_PENCH|nr:uncharacterized protein N7489_000600 [Penicillium chrysogenum]KAJ5250190.1 hypothetical protein N7489_000600 [Penicillium chrysogenum]KAJ5269096.1 hypothetical protein N7505_004854 [Penicillium chrysogenum]